MKSPGRSNHHIQDDRMILSKFLPQSVQELLGKFHLVRNSGLRQFLQDSESTYLVGIQVLRNRRLGLRNLSLLTDHNRPATQKNPKS